MDFIINTLSYLLYLLYSFASNVINIVPVGTILDFLHRLSADSVITSINTMIVQYVYGNGGVIERTVGSIALIAFLLFGIGLSLLGIKYLYSNISEYLFKQKYKGLEDKDVNYIINNNVLTGNDILNDGKIKVSGKELILSYKGFVGLILGRFHAWKESKLGLSNSPEASKMKFFGVITFLTLYLFGFLNRKELKEFKFMGMILATIVTMIIGGLYVRYSNNYILNVYTNTSNNQYNIYDIGNISDNNKPKVKEVSTNISISNVNDIVSYIILVLINNASPETFKGVFNGELTLSEGLKSAILSVLDNIKVDKTLKERFLKDKYIYPEYYYAYVEGKIDKTQFTYYFNNSPLFLNSIKGFQLITVYNNFSDSTAQKILIGLDKFFGVMYKWRQYENLYKITNENNSLITLQKVIYYLNLVPIINPNTLVPLSKAQASLGIVVPEKKLTTIVNTNDTNPLIAGGEATKKRIEEIRKSLQSSKEDHVANPNYLYKVLGIFPVYPISTTKMGCMAYYLFLLVIAFIQFIFLFIMMGAGRFIYLYLIYSMLDKNQRSNFNIEWDVELSDTFIRAITTIVIYIYLVQFVFIQKIL